MKVVKILFISDTHGSLSAWEKIEKLLPEHELVYHLGDVLYHGPRNPLPEGYNPKELSERLKNHKINYIRGNCDADVDIKVLGITEPSKYSMEFFNDFKFFLSHGETFEENPIEDFVKSKDSNVFVYGHTHIPTMLEIDGKLLLNPGSPSLPKNNTFKSVLSVEIINNELTLEFINIENMEVYERSKWILQNSKLSKIE